MCPWCKTKYILLFKIPSKLNIFKRLWAWLRRLREKLGKLCETRIEDMKADAVAFFIEEIFGQEPEEIFGE